METQDYSEKLRDPRWQRRRLEIFQRDNWTCQLCCRTDLELHIHHLYRTTENPWEEPDLHLLTVCRLCHEQQPGNPRGGFKNPKRFYVTDEEWWVKHGKEYSVELREVLSMENTTFSADIYQLSRQMYDISESIHVLRLDWENNGAPEKILEPYMDNSWPQPCEIQMDELWMAFKNGGPTVIAEVLKRRQLEKKANTAKETLRTESHERQYPTEQQTEEVWKAFKNNGKQGIAEYLKEQRQKRKAEESVNPLKGIQ